MVFGSVEVDVEVEVEATARISGGWFVVVVVSERKDAWAWDWMVNVGRWISLEREGEVVVVVQRKDSSGEMASWVAERWPEEEQER